MRYMYLVMASPDSGPPPARLIAEIGKTTARALEDGRMVGGGGLMPISQAVRARVKGGKLIVTDRITVPSRNRRKSSAVTPSSNSPRAKRRSSP